MRKIKKSLLLGLTGVVGVTAIVSSGVMGKSVQASAVVNGDLNNDGYFTLSDVSAALNSALNIDNETVLEMISIGKEQNDSITLDDCRKLLQAVLGIEQITVLFPQIKETPVLENTTAPGVTPSLAPTPSSATKNPEELTEYSDIYIQIIKNVAYEKKWWKGTLYMYKDMSNDVTKADRDKIQQYISQQSEEKSEIEWLRSDYASPDYSKGNLLVITKVSADDNEMLFDVTYRSSEYSGTVYYVKFTKQDGKWIYVEKNIQNVVM